MNVKQSARTVLFGTKGQASFTLHQPSGRLDVVPATSKAEVEQLLNDPGGLRRAGWDIRELPIPENASTRRP